MPDLTLKANDRLPSIQATLTVGQSALDLSTATGVNFIMREVAGTDPKVNAAAVVVSAASGIVRYDWASGDTDVPGSYYGEWEIHWNDGKTQTSPTKGYNTIDIIADLDGAA